MLLKLNNCQSKEYRWKKELNRKLKIRRFGRFSTHFEIDIVIWRIFAPSWKPKRGFVNKKTPSVSTVSSATLHVFVVTDSGCIVVEFILLEFSQQFLQYCESAYNSIFFKNSTCSLCTVPTPKLSASILSSILFNVNCLHHERNLSSDLMFAVCRMQPLYWFLVPFSGRISIFLS